MALGSIANGQLYNIVSTTPPVSALLRFRYDPIVVLTLVFEALKYGTK